MYSSYASGVINYDNVDCVVLTLSLSYILIINWSWSNALPEDSGVLKTQGLIIVPVLNCTTSYTVALCFSGIMDNQNITLFE